MGKYKDGEYISLRWEDTPDEEYVKGHVSPEDFAKAYDQCHSASFEPPMPPVEVRHEYGRWSMQTGEDGPGLVLVTHKEPGAGRFKLTVADYKAVQSAYWNARREAAEVASQL